MYKMLLEPNQSEKGYVAIKSVKVTLLKPLLALEEPVGCDEATET